jgi:catechol 2,3-dioxygenase-like lactoylglutathione lyase family enzyme
VTDVSVTELRLVVTAENYQEALTFYRDVLGLGQLAEFDSPDGHVVLLDAGRATLELTDPGNAAYVDQVEVGRRVAGPLRVAFQVADRRRRGGAAHGGGRRADRAADRHAVELAQRPPHRTRRRAAHPLRRAGLLATGQAAGAPSAC